jgi:hypothetical protein
MARGGFYWFRGGPAKVSVDVEAQLRAEVFACAVGPRPSPIRACSHR